MLNSLVHIFGAGKSLRINDCFALYLSKGDDIDLTDDDFKDLYCQLMGTKTLRSHQGVLTLDKELNSKSKIGPEDIAFLYDEQLKE